MELLVLLFIGFITYLVSLRLNPWVVCSKCQGKPKQQGWVVGVSRFGHVDGNHPAPGSQRVLVDRDDGTTVRFWAWRRYVPKGRYPTELVYYLTSTRSSGSLPAKTTMTLRGIP